jgi:hypothetical protein
MSFSLLLKVLNHNPFTSGFIEFHRGKFEINGHKRGTIQATQNYSWEEWLAPRLIR